MNVFSPIADGFASFRVRGAGFQPALFVPVKNRHHETCFA
jgi:hypothetical protein